MREKGLPKKKGIGAKAHGRKGGYKKRERAGAGDTDVHVHFLKKYGLIPQKLGYRKNGIKSPPPTQSRKANRERIKGDKRVRKEKTCDV